MLTRSASVNPFLESLTTMSFTVPVSVPPGSPLARSSGLGLAIALRSASVIGTGAGVFTAAAGAGEVDACANCTGGGSVAQTTAGIMPLQSHSIAKSSDRVRLSLSTLAIIRMSPQYLSEGLLRNRGSALPDGVLEVSPV